MIVSLSWLKKYVDIPVDARALAGDLTMLGLNVEHLTSAGIEDQKIVVGQVIECEKHPDADRLSVCRVDVGGAEPLAIVCGAPNVAAGQTVAVALVGAQLPGGLKIKKSKIRGVKSNGMICSAIELGLGTDAAGIVVLDVEATPGTPLADVLEESDAILDIEVTPNRPDQLSHIGVAREIAALYSKELCLPETDIPRPRGKPGFSIEISDPNDCYRFFGRVIHDIKVGESPAWLRAAVEGIGLNSINNVVDATNYAMMEYGQPTHTYDLDRLAHKRLGVRRARKGETLVALDDVEYKLEEHSLIITDGDEPVGVAGVIGGGASRVSEETTDLLIESAAFNPRVVRATRKSMNTSTEASYRFERGSDREVCARAADRVCQLIMEVAGGQAGEALDVFPRPWPTREVRIRRVQTRRLLGITLSVDEIAGLLSRLQFPETDRNEESVTVSVPSWRTDIIEEVDLVEEVARLHGYDKIGQGWAFRSTAFAVPDPFDQFLRTTLDHLCARGHTEVLTSSFTEPSRLELMDAARGDRRVEPVGILNPLTSLHGALRTTLLPGVLDVLRRNLDHGVRHLRVCEAGSVFLPRGKSGALPEEPLHLLIAHTRPAGADFWNDLKKRSDLFDIKGEIEVLRSRLRIDLGGQLQYAFDRETGRFSYSDRRGVPIEGGILGSQLANAWDFEQPVWYAELNLTALFEIREGRREYREIPEYPVSKRDLSLVTPAGVTYAEIEKSLVRRGGRLLESVQVFDVYQGDNLEAQSTAFGVRLVFRSKEATLKDAEVDAVVEKIVRKLHSELGVSLRS